MFSISTMRGSGSATVVCRCVALEVGVVLARYAAAPSRTRSRKVCIESVAGSEEIHIGTRLVWTRWSGQAAPTVATWWPSAESTSSSTGSERSVTSTFGGLARDGAAQRREDRCRIAARLPGLVGLRDRRDRRSAGSRRARVDELGGLVEHLDRLLIGLVGAVAPHDEAVLGEHDELQLGVCANRLADLLGERETGPDVLDPGGALAKAIGDERRGRHACRPAR